MQEIETKIEPEESAIEAHLKYVSDDKPGITRVFKDDKFEYFLPDGEKVKDEKVLTRIHSLRIPPAWTDVWICTYPTGHLQATGRDARDRKQYRYHPKWSSVRDETKYGRLIEFGKTLPKIRRATNRDLNLDGMPKEKILATIVQLLEKTLIRVGNEEYAKENQSFGLTTMRDKHVAFSKGTVTFEFKGKSNVRHAISLHDKRLVKIIKKSHDLPGFELFQYIDENGERHTVDSMDVNNYIHEISGHDFTAKDFRTWSGTLLAAEALQEFEKFDSETQAKKNIVAAIESVAKQLGNTKAICRKCYVHPEILNSYLDGTLVNNLNSELKHKITHHLHDLKPEEAAVVIFLQRRLQENSKK